MRKKSPFYLIPGPLEICSVKWAFIYWALNILSRRLCSYIVFIRLLFIRFFDGLIKSSKSELHIHQCSIKETQSNLSQVSIECIDKVIQNALIFLCPMTAIP